MSRLLTILFVCATARPMLAAEKPFAFGTVRFEANRGQADSAVRYLARTRGQQVFFTDTGVVFSPPAGPAIRMKFAGGGRPEWVADGPSSDSISYYIGRDPEKWVKGAPVYDRIAWRGVYPGVDVIFYGDGDRLEYDLVLAPGADPSRVRLQFASPARVSGNAGGVLEISAGGTKIHQRVPAIYQEAASGVRRKIAGDFQTAGPYAATLKLAPYDRTERLVVDPVIEMATYLGGENDDEIVAIADGFVAGNTRSIAFPAFQPALRGGRDVFFRGTGSVVPGEFPRTIYFGTFVIGGSGDDELAGIALQSSLGSITLAGTTTSQDLPAAGTAKYKGGASDGFIANMSVSQSYARLNSVLYVGGSGEDRITAFAGSDFTHAMAGVTDSPDLQVVGDAPQSALAGGKDAFYGILGALGGSSYYGYIGGSGDDAAYAVSVRSTGMVWIGGETRSSDFPFPNSGLAGPSDGFLAEVSAPLYSTGSPVATVATHRIGGNGEDSIRALAAAPSTMTRGLGSIQVLRPFTPADVGFAGTTTSTDLPVRNAARSRFGGERDGFAGMWNVTAAAPRWLSYLGGSGTDEVTAATQDWAGDLFVGGWTRSADLPVVHALQPASAGGEDGMFAVFDSAGALHHLTYFGGSGDDRIRDVRLIYGSVARVAGSTTSTDLPERSPLQDRGGQAEGFWADIGTDFLIGPSELALAKDGMLSFSVRPGRTVFRNPVTYRSSDPSRVRMVYLGRSLNEVTAAPEDNIAIEALTDSGEATITITAPGFSTKNILVKLYPGEFMPTFTSANPISTWASPIPLSALYVPVDPATGSPVTYFGMAIRPGVPPPVINWSVSDPSVFEIANTIGYLQLRALKAGYATISLTVEGFAVRQGSSTFTAATPRPRLPETDIRLGRDLYTNLPIVFGLNGNLVSFGYRGTLTARSANPGRLLLSLAGDQPGRESVTLTMSGSQPTIWAQALAGDGAVQVLLTSSEFDGEVPMTVNLEPAVIRWGSLRNGQSGQTVVDPAVSLTAGVQATQLAFRLQGESGSAASGYRPGAPPVELRLSNSDPKVLELNRLTTTLGSNRSAFTLFGLAAGTSDLTLTTSSENLRPANESVHVEVAARALATWEAAPPSTVYVGKGLQTGVSFRYTLSPQNIEVFSDDADAVLVSSSPRLRGSARLALAKGDSDSFAFQVQGLKGDGETRVRVRFPTGEEREIRVVLLPVGAGFSGSPSGATSQGFDLSMRVVAWALDRRTGIGVFNQALQPGSEIAVRFRSEGAPVRISPDAATLTAETTEARLNYTLPPVGQDATLIVESGADGAVSPVTARMRVARTVAAAPASATLLLARNELRAYNIPSSVTNSSFTVTSSDPDRVLLSATVAAPGSPSLDLPKSTFIVLVHALADSGNVTVRFESAGVTVFQLQVALQPLMLNAYSAFLTPGGSADYSVSLNAYALRPNSGPYRFNVSSSNPSVATVEPAMFEFGGALGTVGAKLRVSGVASGTARLTFAGPPEIVASSVSLTVGRAAQSTMPAYSLGRNLQGGVQIDLGPSFTNLNGAIVKLTSSEPGRLLLSRAASTAGTPSVSVAVPAGDRQTQLIYLQGLEEGEAVIQVSESDAVRAVATIYITRSWVSCGPQAGVFVGATTTRDCGIRYTPTTSNYLQQVSPRSGLDDVDLSLESSAPEIFTVTPQRVSLQSGDRQVMLSGVSPGVGELRLTPPAGFGPSPDGSETLPVSVVEPRLTTMCSTEIVLGKDTQVTCPIFVPSGVTVTATSLDASLLLVSADSKVAGAATAAVASSGISVEFTLQGLANYGTVEVVFSAPGRQDLRVAVALRRSEIHWVNLPYPAGPISLKVGGSTTLTLGMRTGDYIAPSRAGANIAFDVLMDPPGIVTLDPARVVLNGPASRGEVKVQATAPGSVLLRIAAPEGFSASTTPALVSVVP